MSVRDAVIEAYRALGSPVVAVRSSATTGRPGQREFRGAAGYLSRCAGRRLCCRCSKAMLGVPLDGSGGGIPHRSRVLPRIGGTCRGGAGMVAADVAGVLFTADPISGMTDRMLVSASYGLGESVVAAHVNPDTFTLDSQGHAVETIIGDKETRIDLDHTGGTKISPVPPDDRAASCLSDSDLRRLHALGRQVFRLITTHPQRYRVGVYAAMSSTSCRLDRLHLYRICRTPTRDTDLQSQRFCR